MIGDAHTVLRSAVEGAIALHALANDPDFVDQLVAAHFLSRRRLTRVGLETYGASMASATARSSGLKRCA
jgi:hypothetical protein